MSKSLAPHFLKSEFNHSQGLNSLQNTGTNQFRVLAWVVTRYPWGVAQISAPPRWLSAHVTGPESGFLSGNAQYSNYMFSSLPDQPRRTFALDEMLIDFVVGWCSPLALLASVMAGWSSLDGGAGVFLVAGITGVPAAHFAMGIFGVGVKAAFG